MKEEELKIEEVKTFHTLGGVCVCVSEYHNDGEGVVFQERSRLSLHTNRREVTGTHGTLSPDILRKPQVNCSKKTAVV